MKKTKIVGRIEGNKDIIPEHGSHFSFMTDKKISPTLTTKCGSFFGVVEIYEDETN